jgi:hypothetical protein
MVDAPKLLGLTLICSKNIVFVSLESAILGTLSLFA